MRRRILLTLSVLSVAAFTIFFVILFRPFEGGPRYKGLPLSYWRDAVNQWAHHRTPLVVQVKSFFGLRDKLEAPAVLGDDPLAIPTLVHLLGEEEQTHYQAVYALGRMTPSKEVVKAVALSIHDERLGSGSLRNQLLRRYFDQAPEETVAALLDLLEDKDEFTRLSSLQSLRELTPEARWAGPHRPR